MKYFIAGLIVGVAAGGGTLIAANLPNPETGECEAADVVAARSTPTMIDPDGEVTGLRVWLVCGYSYPGASGAVNKDDTFVLELDVDDATMVVEAAGDLDD